MERFCIVCNAASAHRQFVTSIVDGEIDECAVRKLCYFCHGEYLDWSRQRCKENRRRPNPENPYKGASFELWTGIERKGGKRPRE